MSKTNEPEPSPVPAETYTRDYYERAMQGHEQFQSSGGQVLPPRLQIPFDLAPLSTGMNILDIGCGRGEILLHSAQQGANAMGLDYSRAAVELADSTLDAASPGIRNRVALFQANAQRLPLPTNRFDVIFMLDVVEHLYPRELDKALSEALRALKPGGRLVVHTMPSLWYYHYGYPIYRAFQRLRGRSLPADPRDRHPYKEVHVNEQTPRSLRLALDKNGFESKVWLKGTDTYHKETSRVIKWGMRALVSAPLLKLIFCNDIFAVAQKPEQSIGNLAQKNDLES